MLPGVTTAMPIGLSFLPSMHVHSRRAQSQGPPLNGFRGAVLHQPRHISLVYLRWALGAAGPAPGSQKPTWGGVVLGLVPWLWWHQEALRDILRNHTDPGQADGGNRGVDPKEES